MYSSVNELPTEVLNSLDEEDATVWMEAYNKADPHTEEEIVSAKRKAWRKCKTLPSSFSFDIVATVETVDVDGELITLQTVKDWMDLFIKEGGGVQTDHGNYHVGCIWDWEDYVDPTTGCDAILVHGNVFGGRDENPEYIKARRDFINGKNSLSIAGDATIEGYECDEEKCFVRRNMLSVQEISLCYIPANPYAKMVWFNEDAIIKSHDESPKSIMNVQKVGVHKSYASCDYEEVRKSMRGYDVECKVQKDGCHIKSKGMRETDIMKAMDDNGLMYEYDIESKEFVAKSFEKAFHKEFINAYESGVIDENGVLKSCIVQEDFTRLFKSNMIKEENGTWMFNRDSLEKDAMCAGSSGASNGTFGDGWKNKDKRVSFKEILDWKSRR